jgi:hypothetical protein
MFLRKELLQNSRVEAEGIMKKIIVMLIVLMVIEIGLLSGCQEEKVDYHKLDYSKVEYTLSSTLVLEGNASWGGIRIFLEFKFPNPYFRTPTVMDGCTIKELNYTLTGNGHYVGGQTLTKLMSGNNTLTLQALGYFQGRIEIFTLNNSHIPSTREYLINIDPDLKTAIENKSPIQWNMTGLLSFYTPDKSEIIKIPVTATYIQTKY